MIPDEARRLVRKTPLLFAPPLGCFVKLESLQATGSFKIRGAAVKLARLHPIERERGVVTASAGNHGLGVALAARELGVAATIVVTRSAARVKREGIARLGAQILEADGEYEVAERQAIALAQDRKRTYVPAFDDEDVIDGNGGWLAEELLEQHAGLKRVIVPVGGGGLSGGLARALAPRGVQVIGVSPSANCAMHDSLAQGRALTSYRSGGTVCEGLEGPVAERTFAIAKQHLDSIVLVDEPEIVAAIAFAWRTMGFVVEPSSAVVIAAARAGHVMAEDDTALVVTGGNLDADLLARALCS